MSSWKIWTVIAVVAVSLAGGIAYRKSLPPLVKTALCERSQVIDAVYATGEVLAIRRADISAEASGRVDEVFFEAGDTVSAGDLLARIETISATLSKNMAKEALARAKSSWEEAKKDRSRLEGLWAERAISKSEFDRALRAEERAEADFKRQRQALLIEEDKVVRTSVTSPLSGVVVSRQVEAGEYATLGAQLFSVIDPTTLLIVADVDETEVVKIRTGQSAAVSLDAYPGRRFAGKVERVIPKIDEITRTGEVRIGMNDAPAVLREGMSATVNVVTRRAENALVAPRDAVVLKKDSALVYIVNDNSEAVPIEFIPGAMDENRVEIADGDLSEGQAVVLSPPSDLKKGDKVRVEKD